MSEDEKTKIQREILMEKIRMQGKNKTWSELAKSFRMSMLEKRYQLDSVEKSIIRKCLDSLTHSIKVTTRAGLCERLESLSRQLGLKLSEDSNGLFISSDMFYLEIILESNGTLKDVKVHHECKIEQNESELASSLRNGDFADFTVQLEGLSSIYQLNAEPKIKSKAFVALQAIETDLFNLFKLQSYNKDVITLLNESPVGVVQKRRGGHPMKIIYFVPPYDLLDIKSKSILPLTMDTLNNKKDVGLFVTVNLEASSANKLQIQPTIHFAKDNIPVYSQLSATNSILLPATFVLRLNKPIPVCSNLLLQMGLGPQGKSLEIGDMMNLVIEAASKDTNLNSSKGLYVTLPDQCHCYFLTKNKKFTGSIITNVPFTELSQVPKIVSVLKQQALFYTLLSSCVRGESRTCGSESATILEVNAISIHTISVSLQHPYEESLASVEFDINNLSNFEVRIYSLTNSSFEIHNKILTKVAKTSLSIPVTIRCLLKLWDQEHLKNSIRASSNTGDNIFDMNSYDRHGNEYRNKERNSSDSSGSSFLMGQNSRSQQFFSSSATSVCKESINQFPIIEPREFTTTTATTANHEDFSKNPKSENKLANSSNSNFKFGQNNDSDSSLGDPLKQVTGLTIERVNNNSNSGSTNSNNSNKEISGDVWNRNSNDNTVSITPISSKATELSSNLNGILNKVQTSISIMPVVGGNSSSSSSSKSLSPSRKRRKKEHSSTSSGGSEALKVIEISSKLPLSGNSSVKSSKSSSNSQSKKVQTPKSSPSSKTPSSSPKHSPLLNKHSNAISSGGGKPNLTTLKNTTGGNLMLTKPISKEPKVSSSYLESSSLKKISSSTNSKNVEDHYIFDDSDGDFDIFDSSPSNRKNSSLNAVIDKLKAHNNELSILDTAFEETTEKTKFNSEYMIKPGSDGMKMKLISSPSHNSSSSSKSTSKRPSSSCASGSSSSSSSNLGNLSPNKKHTGLKPGVSAGPRSRGSSNSSSSVSGSNSNSNFYKSNSSDSLPKSSNFSLSKSLSSHALNTTSSLSLAARSNMKDLKAYSGSSNSSSSKPKINEKIANRQETTDLMKILQFSSGKNALEGFQIPKLSKSSSTTTTSEDLAKKNQTLSSNSQATSSVKPDFIRNEDYKRENINMGLKSHVTASQTVKSSENMKNRYLDFSSSRSNIKGPSNTISKNSLTSNEKPYSSSNIDVNINFNKNREYQKCNNVESSIDLKSTNQVTQHSVAPASNNQQKTHNFGSSNSSVDNNLIGIGK